VLFSATLFVLFSATLFVYMHKHSHALPITRLSRATSTTAGVTRSRSLMVKTRAICVSSRLNSRKGLPALHQQPAHFRLGQGTEFVDEADAGVELGVARQPFLQSWHPDQHQAHAALVEDGANLLQAGHPQAVRLVDDQKQGGVADLAAAELVLLVLGEVGVSLSRQNSAARPSSAPTPFLIESLRRTRPSPSDNEPPWKRASDERRSPLIRSPIGLRQADA
jgi:hypothetical protein